MNEHLVLRREMAEDYRAVEEMTRLAFWNQSVPGCNEHYLLHAMRSHPDFVPELDLLLEAEGQIVAHVAYTRARLMGADGRTKQVLTFGPLSVHPDWQRKGCGKRLLTASFEQAIAMGYDAVVIFGNPENYVTSGFRSCKRFGVTLDGQTYPVALLVKELQPGALSGTTWVYQESAAYEMDEAGFDAYEATFPPLEKTERPSQELFYIYSRSQVVG